MVKVETSRWSPARIASLLIGAALFASRAFADSGLPVGAEIIVAQNATQQGFVPQVAKSAAGNFVVAWSAPDPQTAEPDILGQLYAADGTAQGGPFIVRQSGPSFHQQGLAVAMDAAGDFVVGWTENENDLGYAKLYLQFYAATGTPLKGPILVANSDGPGVDNVALSMNSAGDTAVTWSTTYGWYFPSEFQFADLFIWARPYALDGTARGPAQLVSSVLGQALFTKFPSYSNATPAVAVDGSGAFVVAWAWGNDLTGSKVYARRYSDTGKPLARAFTVNSPQSEPLVSASVAADTAGDFVILWRSPDPAFPQNETASLLYARRYDSTGTAQGAEFSVGNAPALSAPALAMDAEGDFVVDWVGPIDLSNPDSSSVIYMQRYDAADQPLAAPYPVDSNGIEQVPAVASDATGNFIAAWNRVDPAAPSNSIVAQVFSGP